MFWIKGFFAIRNIHFY